MTPKNAIAPSPPPYLLISTAQILLPTAIVSCIPSELNQIWNNLISNAIQAMKGRRHHFCNQPSRPHPLHPPLPPHPTPIGSPHLNRT